VQAVWVALIVAVPAMIASVAGPLLLARQVGRRQDRIAAQLKADNKRVADQAAEAARLLVERQDAADAQRALAAELLVSANERLGGKLDTIHILVNSNMTEALQGQLDRTDEVLIMLREMVDLNRTAGREPSAATLAYIKATEDKAAELRAAQNDRLLQARVADAQIVRHA
jgi:hypothetical protein